MLQSVASGFELGWDMLVAVGTLALAVVTAALAKSTRDLVQRAVDDQRGQWRPILVPAEREVARTEDGFVLHLVNAGRGPAFGISGQLRSGKNPLGASNPNAQADSALPGQEISLPFRLTDPSSWSPGRLLEFEVTCVDISEQFHRSRIRASVTTRPKEIPVGERPIHTHAPFVEETGRYLLPVHGSHRAIAQAEREERLLRNRARRLLTSARERFERPSAE